MCIKQKRERPCIVLTLCIFVLGPYRLIPFRNTIGTRVRRIGNELQKTDLYVYVILTIYCESGSICSCHFQNVVFSTFTRRLDYRCQDRTEFSS